MNRFCPDCMEGLLGGSTGRCAHCDGTGTNTQLDSDNPKCPFCDGTGVCATCHGTCRPPGYGGDSGEIQTLFGN